MSDRVESESVEIRDMKRMLWLAVVAACALSCARQESDFPAIEGWTRTGDVSTYDADNLWEYIDGAAELFIEYDVQTCMAADLSSGDIVVTVELYDMATPLDAFGVFKREHPAPGMSIPEATAAAIAPPYQALLLKGATYAKVNAVEGELTAEAGRRLLEELASALPGQTGYPSELEQLPANGMVEGSEGYKPRGYMGLTELSRCLYAEYAGANGETWEGFVMLPPTGSTPASVWEALAAEWESLQDAGRTVLYKEVPYRGLVGVVQTDGGLLGVSGAPDQAALLQRLEDLTR